MITKITCRYSFEVLDFNCNGFGSTFSIGVSYLGIITRHQCMHHYTDVFAGVGKTSPKNNVVILNLIK